MRKKITILIFIACLGAVLRFYGIATNPPALTWDETSWGYNAYSLGIDGRDEFGRFLPYDYLESFGDFKPPMYAYLSILPVKLFGLNEFSTRFSSAFFGTITVILTYFLVLQIFSKAKLKEKYAFMASILLAISPWHINLSRAAFEANVASFFLVAGVTGFLFAMNKKPKFLIVSIVCFVASMYTFNTSRIVAPLLVLLLSFIFFKQLLTIKKEMVLALVVGILLILPITGFLLSPQASLRFKEVNIFSNADVVKTANQEVANDNNAAWSKVIHNRRLGYGVSYVKHYLDNLNPSFLFVKGDGNPKFSTQDVGQLYLWCLPFLLIGSLLLFRKREGSWWIIPLWLCIGIIPAGTARETPHALRTETVLPTFQILTAYGFINFSEWIKKRYKNILIYKSFLAIAGLLLCMNVFYYLYGYYVHYAREFSGEWQYGYKQSIIYIKEHQESYDEIRVTNALGRPYIYYLFYLQTPPNEFRSTSKVSRDTFGFVTVMRVGKYIFDKKEISDEGLHKKILYVDLAANVVSGAHILQSIPLLNGNPNLILYER